MIRSFQVKARQATNCKDRLLHGLIVCQAVWPHLESGAAAPGMTMNDPEYPIHVKVRFLDDTPDVCTYLLWLSELTMNEHGH